MEGKGTAFYDKQGPAARRSQCSTVQCRTAAQQRILADQFVAASETLGSLCASDGPLLVLSMGHSWSGPRLRARGAAVGAVHIVHIAILGEGMRARRDAIAFRLMTVRLNEMRRGVDWA